MKGNFALKRFLAFCLTHAAAVATILWVPPSDATLIVASLALVLFGQVGIGLGFHRLLSHNAYTCGTTLQILMATLGTLAYQGGPIRWAMIHRAHHKDSDVEGDPHGRNQGFWFSHCGWIFYDGPNGFNSLRGVTLVRDLIRVPHLVWLDKYASAVTHILFLLSWICWGAPFALWVFPVRIVASWHLTWVVNSICHSERSGHSEPRNVPALGLLTFGEALHLNHHEKPSRAYFAARPLEWLVDPGSWLLWLLRQLGWVRLRSERPYSGRPSETTQLEK